MSCDCLINRLFTDNCLESEIETKFRIMINQQTQSTCKKAHLGIGITDGIFSKNGKWILQETKRDINWNTEQAVKQFLQCLMYLGNIYFDINPYYDIKDFKGVILDSKNYFCFIPKTEIDKAMKDFETLWNNNYRVAPSSAHQHPELLGYARQAFRDLQNIQIAHTSDGIKYILNKIWN